MLEASIVGFSDFECTLQPLNNVDTSTGVQSPKKEKAETQKQYQQHHAVSHFTKFVPLDPDFSLPDVDFPQKEPYVGEDAATHYLDYVTKVADKIFEHVITKPKDMVFTEEDERSFQAATECHICVKRYPQHQHPPGEDCEMCKKKLFEDGQPILHCHNEHEKNCHLCERNGRIRVRDHSHELSHYRGAAHQSCNLQYNNKPKSWKLPIFFHNLRGYDGHLLIRGLKKRHGRVRIIPTNIDRYLAIQVGRVQFLDSFQFTLQGLDSLVSTMEDKDFVHLKKEFGFEESSHCQEKFELLRKKGVFFYDYFDSLSVLEQTSLPPQSAFYNTLEDRECTDKEYAHAERVWKVLGFKTLREYHDLYLKTDVLLLCDFFQKFRRMCMDTYGVDAAHYYSTPGMAWDISLKLTGVQLELLDNEPMYTFIEKGSRGGISQISLRHARANNPAMEDYDPCQPDVYLLYLDSNNLYGKAMSCALPTGGFRWLTQEEIEELDLKSLDDDADGYILEVDLEVPHQLHDLHNSYPLAPESISIDESMLSPFQQQFPDRQKKTSTKLAPNLYDKKKYIVHYKNLNYYIEQGLILKKIHRVLTFKQSPWLGEYIAYNTAMRSVAKSTFAKDFFKLMNNSVFGKTQENLRNRINVEIVTDRKTALKRAAKPSMKRSETIHEDLVVMETAITNLKLDKPVYVGFVVLEISKLWMYQFHYSKMIKWFKNIQLCFTDTDSLLYRIEGQNVYDVMKEHAEDFDFSEYPHDHMCYDPVNCKALGKFKDELHSLALEEFIGLRAKCYSLLFRGKVKDNVVEHQELDEKQVAKGTKKSVKKRHLRHEHYRSVLEELKVVWVKQNTLQSRTHSIGSYSQTRVSLTAYDTKRWIMDDGIQTLAHGHYKTQ